MPLRGPTLDTSVPPWFKAKERLTVEIFEEYSSASIWVANEIANLIRQRQSEGNFFLFSALLPSPRSLALSLYI